MTAKTSGVAVFYTRDSGGKHETTPGQYLLWARKQAQAIGVSFQATSETIQRMIDRGEFVSEGVFLDYDVKGNQLNRKGLDALVRAVESDRRITHVFIPRRDRLARPDDAVDGITI